MAPSKRVQREEPAPRDILLHASPSSERTQLLELVRSTTSSDGAYRSSRSTTRETTKALVQRLSAYTNIEDVLIGNSIHSSKFLSISTKRHNYSLNKDTALKKKQNACQRPIMCEGTEGNNHVRMRCQAGVYELIKRATLMYYGEIQHRGTSADIELWQDKTLSFTQAVIKVSPLYSNRGSYSVNLYHTTSSLSINGTGARKFLKEEWPLITEIIDEINSIHQNTDPAILNENIKLCLQDALDGLSSNNKPPRPNRGKHKGHSAAPAICHEQVPITEQEPPIQPTHVPASQTSTTENGEEDLNTSPWQLQPINIQTLGERMNDTAASTNLQRVPCLTQARTPTITATPEQNIQLSPHNNIAYNEVFPTQGGNASDDTSINATEESICKECHSMKMRMLALETEMAGMQRKLKQQEKALKQRETDLNAKAMQYLNSKTHITTLESQIKQLQENNRLLKERQEQYTPVPPPNINYSQPSPNGNGTEDRIRNIEKQIQDMRIAQLEARVENMAANRQYETTHQPTNRSPSQQVPHHNIPTHPYMMQPPIFNPLSYGTIPRMVPPFYYQQAPAWLQNPQHSRHTRGEHPAGPHGGIRREPGNYPHQTNQRPAEERLHTRTQHPQQTKEPHVTPKHLQNESIPGCQSTPHQINHNIDQLACPPSPTPNRSPPSKHRKHLEEMQEIEIDPPDTAGSLDCSRSSE